MRQGPAHIATGPAVINDALGYRGQVLTGDTAQESHQLGSGQAVLGIKDVAAQAGSDLVLHQNRNGLGIGTVFGHIAERKCAPADAGDKCGTDTQCQKLAHELALHGKFLLKNLWYVLC